MLILKDADRRSRLISDDYRQQQTKLHEDPRYGEASLAAAPIVSKICNDYGVTELLDYGAGKGRLVENLDVAHRMAIQLYDPAVEDWSQSPDPAECVCCIDVLEHIEPELLDNVLDDLQRVTARIGIFTVATTPAMKTLADGRNAHLIQQEPDWWLPKLMQRFELHIFQRSQDGFLVIVMAKLTKDTYGTQ